MRVKASEMPWPAASLQDVQTRLTAPGEPYEMELVDIAGIPTRVWKHAPANMRVLVETSRGHGDILATILDGERISYEAQYRAIAVLAAEMAACGTGKGDRVAIAMRNLPEWIVAFFAATAIGAIAVPLNAWWTGDELAYGLRDSGARLLVADEERWQRIAPHAAGLPELDHVFVSRSAAAPGGARRLEDVIGAPDRWDRLPLISLPDAVIAPDDDAAILYTSGTTGRPKGALATHRNFTTGIVTAGFVAAQIAARRGDPLPAATRKVGLTVIPLFHVTALAAGLMGSMAAGHTAVYMRKFEPVRAMELIEREKINATGGVPTIAWQLLEHPERRRFDLSSLDSLAYGGAPAAPELVRKIVEELNAYSITGWGMTETTATVTKHGAEDYLNRPDSCGPAVAVADIKVMDLDGTMELPAGEVGELWARGPMVVKGYWRNPEATAATFVDGWVRTGDMAKIDEEGFCYIVDRAKDVIIRGGENIYSSEVENILYDHPAVMDCALLGRPHRTLGEEPVAVVHLTAGAAASERELQQWVGARLAAFKVPVAVRFSEATLPRNANGKILKRDLKALFDAGLAA